MRHKKSQPDSVGCMEEWKKPSGLQSLNFFVLAEMIPIEGENSGYTV
jgi:hypothetical protein